MAANKFGLADLKRLRRDVRRRAGRAQQTSAAARPAPVLDDARLFQQAMQAVQPLRTRGAVAPNFPTSLPRDLIRARQQRALGEDPPDLALSPMEAARLPSTAQPDDFLRSGHGTDVLRRLRKGRWPLQASLDLHGCTLEQADQQLAAFLAQAAAVGVRCVRVVHGVGYGSPGGVGVLKPHVLTRLKHWHLVVAFTQCAAHEGGQGAVKVLLRSSGSARHA